MIFICGRKIEQFMSATYNRHPKGLAPEISATMAESSKLLSVMVLVLPTLYSIKPCLSGLATLRFLDDLKEGNLGVLKRTSTFVLAVV